MLMRLPDFVSGINRNTVIVSYAEFALRYACYFRGGGDQFTRNGIEFIVNDIRNTSVAYSHSIVNL